MTIIPRLSAALLGILLASAGLAPASAAAVEFPSYETVRSLDRYATPEEYRAAVTDDRFVMERVTYASDGLDVHAYVYRPAVPSGKLPVVIFNRGSWTWPSFAAELVAMANRLASQGYLVVAPMYRGSGGAAGVDELGGADLADLFNLLPVIERLGYADSERLYLYGESRGGMMVYQALRDAFPAKAAVVVGAFSDLEAMLRNPYWLEAGRQIWPDLEANRDQIARRRSAVLWPEKIDVPILILHGAKDEAVEVDQSLRMAKALADHGKRFALRVVEDGDHTLSARTADRDRWAIEWFESHRGGGADAAASIGR